MERLVEPDRIFTFRVTWIDDNGEVQTNTGYRIQFNSAIGPYKGGLRFHRAVTPSTLKYLLNTENQTAYALTTGYLPIRESSVELPEVQAYMAESDLYATAIKQLDYSTAYVHFGEMGSMDTQLTWALDDIENGTDPKRAFQDAVENLIADLPD